MNQKLLQSPMVVSDVIVDYNESAANFPKILPLENFQQELRNYSMNGMKNLTKKLISIDKQSLWSDQPRN